jgi:hypothetical protein
MYGNHHETTIFPANTIDLLCFFFNIIKTKIKRIHISAPRFSLKINVATLRNFDVST